MKPEDGKAKLDERFLINIKGNDFVQYAGLLDLAHQKGLAKLYVEALQIPTEDNGYTAICKAVAESKDGNVFTDIGDANPRNTNKMVVEHILRIASTRSKARALRDFTNIGITCLEELGEMDETVGTKPNNGGRKAGNNKAVKETSGKKSTKKKGNQNSQPKISVAQEKAIHNIAKRHDIKLDTIEDMVNDKFNTTLLKLTSFDAASLIQQLQSQAN
jgi:hypothetical protein